LVCLEVRNVRATPRRAIPGDELARGIKGLAARIARGAVIKHTAIGGPCPRPIDRLTDAGRIRVIPSCHEVAGRPPGTTEDPAARSRAAVVARFGKPGELLACLAYDLGRVLRVRQVLERLAGELPGELLGR